MQITNLQVRQILFWSIIALIASMLPYLLGWLLTPDDAIFTGALVNPGDVSVYLSAVNQGQDGNWLFDFRFSPEPLTPRLMYMVYITLGQAMRLVGGTSVFWFQALRIISGVILLISLVFWVRWVLPNNVFQQRIAWLLIVFGSGFGWLVAALAPLDTAQIHFITPDIRTPELSTLFVMLSTPHFMLGLAGEALLFGCVIQITRPDANRARWAMIGVLAGVCTGVSYPYNVALAGLVIGLYMLWVAWNLRRIPWEIWGYVAIILVTLSSIMFYYGVWTTRDANWYATQFAGNNIPPPSPLGVVVGFGLPGILAVIGGWHWLRQRLDALVPIWVLTNLTCLYLPIPFSGRFLLGLMIPIATLAAYGLVQVVIPAIQGSSLFEVIARLTPTPKDTLYRVILILTIPSTLMVVVLLLRNVIVNQDYPHYLPLGEWQASQWLADNTGEDALILASFEMGNQLPTLISGKVFAGQLFNTIDVEEKLDLIARFWDEDTSTQWRESFVAEWGITHIYQGYYENQLMNGTVTPPGTVVYQQSGVTIYEVTQP